MGMNRVPTAPGIQHNHTAVILILVGRPGLFQQNQLVNIFNCRLEMCSFCFAPVTESSDAQE